jgi:hypothetical protein
MKPLLVLIGLVILIAIVWVVLKRKPYEPTIQSTYQGEPSDYRGGKTLLVAVYAPWAPVWQATEAELAKVDKSKYDILLVSADREKDKVRTLGVNIVPTVLVIQDGKTIKTLPNMMSIDQIQ